MKIPPMFRVLRKSLIEGVLMGWLLLVLLLITNVGGLSDKILNTSSAALGIFLLAFFFALTFGSVSMGMAIMGLSDKNKSQK